MIFDNIIESQTWFEERVKTVSRRDARGDLLEITKVHETKTKTYVAFENMSFCYHSVQRPKNRRRKTQFILQKLSFLPRLPYSSIEVTTKDSSKFKRDVRFRNFTSFLNSSFPLREQTYCFLLKVGIDLHWSNKVVTGKIKFFLSLNYLQCHFSESTYIWSAQSHCQSHSRSACVRTQSFNSSYVCLHSFPKLISNILSLHFSFTQGVKMPHGDQSLKRLRRPEKFESFSNCSNPVRNGAKSCHLLEKERKLQRGFAFLPKRCKL